MALQVTEVPVAKPSDLQTAPVVPARLLGQLRFLDETRHDRSGGVLVARLARVIQVGTQRHDAAAYSPEPFDAFIVRLTGAFVRGQNRNV